MDKFKILRIIARLNIGGPAIHTILLTEELNKNCFESILVTGNVDKIEGDMLYLAKEKGINPIFIPQLQRKVDILRDLISLVKIYNLIRRQRPDIVHTHTAKAGAIGRVATLLYRLSGFNKKPKSIHTFHGHVLEGYFGRIKTNLFIWIERILAKITDRIIVVNQRTKEDLL